MNKHVQYYKCGTIMIRMLRHSSGITSIIAIVFLINNDTNENNKIKNKNMNTNTNTNTKMKLNTNAMRMRIRIRIRSLGYTIQYLTSLDRIGSSLWIRRICYDILFNT